MWPWRTCGFFGLFLAACVLALYYPVIAVANYMLIYQIVPGSRWWGMPIHALGVRFSLWAALSLVAGMFVSWVTGRAAARRPFITLWEVLLCGLVGVAVVGYISIEAPHPRQWAILEKFTKMVIFLLCMTHLVATRKGVRVVLWVLVVGSLYLGHEAYTTPTREFLTGRLTSIGGPDFHDSSGFAAHMAAMVPLIGVTFLTTRRWWWRALPLISSVFTFNAIILCRTRSAFLGLIAGAVTAALMVPRSWRWKAYPALIVFTIGAYSLVDQNFIDRMETMASAEQRETDAAVNIRRELWDAGLRMVNDHPMGVGIGNFPIWVGRYEWHLLGRSSHNTFILCATEFGVPGLLVFVGIILTSAYQLFWAYRHSDDTDDPAETRLWVYGVLVSLVIYLVAGQFTERFYTESFWWVMAMSTCIRRAALNEIAERMPRAVGDEIPDEEIPYAAKPVPG